MEAFEIINKQGRSVGICTTRFHTYQQLCEIFTGYALKAMQ